MKVFVAGGTGVVGRRAVARMVGAGHEVTALSRSAERDELLRSLGAAPARVDLFDAGSVKDAVAGHEAVVNLATNIPPIAKAMGRRAFATNDRIRTEGSRNLVDAALATGAGRYVQESVAFGYADGGEGWIDESCPFDPTGPVATAAAAEAEAARFGDAVVLRYGWFYAADSEQTATLVAAVRRGLAPLPGDPDGFVSPIHADDAASAAVAALTAPAGTYNVADDEPLPRRAYVQALADLVGARRPRFVLRPFDGISRRKAEPLLRSHRLSNRTLREATGWAPTFPSVREGWKEVVG